MRVERHIVIEAPAAEVWRRIGSPRCYPRFMPAVTGCEPLLPGYRMTIRVGAVELGSVVEVISFVPERELRWTSVQGVGHRGRWRLDDRGDGTVEVALTVEYHAPGGILGALAEPAALPAIRRGVQTALACLKAELEGPTPPSAIRRLATSAAELAHDARVLAGAGLVAPSRPDRLLRAGGAAARWRVTPAGGYAIAAALHPDEPALIDERGALTFARLHQSTNGLARRLSEAGAGPDGAVAILCRNHRAFAQATLAASKLGADALLLDTGLAASQLREILARERPAALVHDEEFSAAVAGRVASRGRLLAWTDRRTPPGVATVDEVALAGDTADLPAPPRRGRVLGVTFGATGPSSATARPEPAGLAAAAALLERIPLRARERTLIASPLFHPSGSAHLALSGVLSSTLVLRRRFDAEETLALVERHRIGTLVIVPAMLERILALPADRRARYDTRSLRVVLASGSRLPGGRPVHGRLRRPPLHPLRLQAGRVGEHRDAGGPPGGARDRRPSAARRPGRHPRRSRATAAGRRGGQDLRRRRHRGGRLRRRRRRGHRRRPREHRRRRPRR